MLKQQKLRYGVRVVILLTCAFCKVICPQINAADCRVVYFSPQLILTNLQTLNAKFIKFTSLWLAIHVFFLRISFSIAFRFCLFTSLWVQCCNKINSWICILLFFLRHLNLIFFFSKTLWHIQVNLHFNNLHKKLSGFHSVHCTVVKSS